VEKATKARERNHQVSTKRPFREKRTVCHQGRRFRRRSERGAGWQATEKKSVTPENSAGAGKRTGREVPGEPKTRRPARLGQDTGLVLVGQENAKSPNFKENEYLGPASGGNGGPIV